jgi:hypothetical protein
MKFTCTASPTGDGRWRLRHDSPAVGPVEVVAATRDEALDKLRGEIRYHLELCPCTGESFQHIDVDIVETAAK